MTSHIAKRVGSIISGSLHAIMDAIEGCSPEIIMEQAIREVEHAITDVRAELGKVIASRHLANKRLVQKNAQHDEYGNQAEIAVQERRDDLAEIAIARQLDIEAQIPVLEQAIADSAEKEKELDGYIQALLAKRREMEEELETYRKMSLANPSDNSESGEAINGNSKLHHKVEHATNSFDRMMKRQTGVVSRDRVNGKDASQLAELEEMARKNRIQERLAAVKSAATA